MSACPRCGKKPIIRPAGGSSRPGSNPTVGNPNRGGNDNHSIITGLRYVPK